MSQTGFRGLMDLPPSGGEGEAPMTEAQAAELRGLCARLDEPMDATLTQTQAQMRIDHLKGRLED